MRANVLLLLTRDRARRVIAEVRRDRASRDRRAVELVECVSALMLLEQAVVQVFQATKEELSRQALAHDRARALLFRVVTAAGEDRAVDRTLDELAGVFADRSNLLRERLVAALDDASLARLGRRLEGLVRETAPPSPRRVTA